MERPRDVKQGGWCLRCHTYKWRGTRRTMVSSSRVFLIGIENRKGGKKDWLRLPGPDSSVAGTAGLRLTFTSVFCVSAGIAGGGLRMDPDMLRTVMTSRICEV